MRFIFLFLLIWVVFEYPVFPQKQAPKNLIPNGDFEEYQDCPKTLGEVRIGILRHWQAMPPDCTPDFFHMCSQDISPKNSPCGELMPQKGKGYLGLIVRVGASAEQNTDELFYREHVQARLQEPLKHRNRYVFSMYVSLSEYSAYAMSRIGILFTKKPILVNDKLQLFPQIETNFIDTQKQWILISDTLIAEGNEEYITLGDFSSYAKKDIRKVNEEKIFEKKFSYNRAYYFFDALQLSWLDVLPAPLLIEPPTPPYKLTAPREPTGLEKAWELEPTEFGYLKPNTPIILKNVLFEFGKTVLLEKSTLELEKLYRLMQEFRDMRVMISGHTDEIGKTEGNLRLSEARAKSVHTYLIKRGITENRLFFSGQGSSMPIESNKTEAGRRKNRRVEFVVIGE